MDRATFLAERRKGVGGSDAAALFGLSKWRTPLQVYREKIGEATDEPEHEALYWGTVHEPAIRQRYSEVTGAAVYVPDKMIRSVQYPWMIAHLDGVVDTGDDVFGLECKTADARTRYLWGDPWTDQVPDAYAVQVQHYMAVTGYEKFHIAVLFGGNNMEIYAVPRHEGVINRLIEEERTFWLNHVELNVPPEPIDADERLSAAASRYPSDDGTEMDEQEAEAFEPLVQKYLAHEADMKEAEAKMKEVKAEIMEKMGETKVVKGANWSVRWGSVAGRKTIDYKSLIRACEIPEDIVEQHTKIGNPYRTFRIRVMES